MGTDSQNRVLILDDDTDTVAFLCRMLAPLGVGCIGASSCAAAREAAREGTIQVVIADALLPDGDGMALAIELKAAYGCRVLMVTGINPPATGLPAGVDQWIIKPVMMPDLQNAVRSLLGVAGEHLQRL